MTFKINGSINRFRLPNTKETISVICWDKDLIFDDNLGEVNPDASGNFSLLVALPETGEGNPDLFFKIMAGKEVLYTSKIYTTNGLLEKNEITGFIEKSTIDVGCIN